MSLQAQLSPLLLPENEARRLAVNAKARKWRAANREKARASVRRWREVNRDKNNALARAYYQEKKDDPDFKKENVRRVAEWTNKNMERQRVWRRAYTKTPRGRELINAKARRERANNPLVAMKHRLRARINGLLKHEGKKRSSTPALMGCSFQQFKTHLESLFVPGMTWENRSLWHIDHIRPCAFFNLLDPEQQKCCFHYTNLQPLWAKDNIIKSNKCL